MKKRWLSTVIFALFSCTSPSSQHSRDAGSLVRITTQAQVGVLLDEIPPAMRERVAQTLLAKDEAFWIARAKRQLELMSYRLAFRSGFYPDLAKRQLPLPPDQVWQITLAPEKAQRRTIDNHDYVQVSYTFKSALVSDVDSPADAEPALAKMGGSWDEPFVLPIDPELLVQRTGYACMDEAEFPPNSVDSESPQFFYDHECEVEEKTSVEGCHRTRLPGKSCIEALDAAVGKVSTVLHFERVAYSEAAAAPYRVGAVTNPDGADLQVVAEELAVNRITYRYIPHDSCAIAEGCVGGSGWRRLLQFNASEKNLGKKAVHIGDVDAFVPGEKSSQNIDHHIYEYSACHEHYHFSHYGNFTYGGASQRGSKRAFCLQSVARYSNNESSPLTSPYGTCSYQGISPGWGDQYQAGIECQWIDITDVDTRAAPATASLDFVSNPDGFLCEGKQVLDQNEQLTFEATAFKTAEGATVDRPVCDFAPNWDSNNVGKREVTLPLAGQGLVTSACAHGEIGPKRNCGFTYQGEVLKCSLGDVVHLRCMTHEGQPQVTRICEASRALDAGVACSDEDALTQGVVDSVGLDIAFTCPSERDASEPGGVFAIYVGPVFPEDSKQGVTCKVGD